MLQEFIFQDAPFPSAHASTIEATPHGLICACFGGTAERHPDVGIWVSRHENSGWTPPIEVAKDEIYPCWNPVLFQLPSGPLMLFYKVGPRPTSWWGMSITSRDGGQTWSEPRALSDGALGPIKNKPVQLSDGAILSPSSTEDKINGWRVHFERSDDGGQSWQLTPPLGDGHEIAAIQPSVLFHKDGRLQAIGRTRQRQLFSLESEDNGRTWNEMRLLDVPNPNSGTDAVTLRDGRHLLVYNATTHGRTPLNIALSDDGQNWTPALTLESDEGEFSYPAVIQAPDGTVHLSYTWNRKFIKHCALDAATL